MERREFLNWVGTGTIASFIPVAIAACGPNPSSNTADPSSNATTTETPPTDTAIADAGSSDGRVNMGSAEELNTEGFLYSKEDNIIVVKNDDGSLSALNPKCTHQQCPVEWDSASTSLTCPCHGSAFATDGSVITGPASTALASYADVMEDGGNIFVTTS